MIATYERRLRAAHRLASWAARHNGRTALLTEQRNSSGDIDYVIELASPAGWDEVGRFRRVSRD